MRDPFGQERSICLKCQKHDRECLEFLPSDMDTDCLDNGDFDWEGEMKDLDERKVLPCILESITAYRRRTFDESNIVCKATNSSSLLQNLVGGGSSGSTSSPSSPSNNPCIATTSSGSSPMNKSGVQKSSASTLVQKTFPPTLAASAAANRQGSTSTSNAANNKFTSYSRICHCGCDCEDHLLEVVSKQEKIVLNLIRPHFQMLKLSYSVMQSVTDTVHLDIPRTEFTYGEIYDVAFLRFLNELWDEYYGGDNFLSAAGAAVSSPASPASPKSAGPGSPAFSSPKNNTGAAAGSSPNVPHTRPSKTTAGAALAGNGSPTNSKTTNLLKNNTQTSSNPGTTSPSSNRQGILNSTNGATCSPKPLSPFHDQSPDVSKRRPFQGKFLDLGCGTGKAVFLATWSKWQFEKAEGVELLPGLHKLACYLKDSIYKSCDALSPKTRSVAKIPQTDVEFFLGDVAKWHLQQAGKEEAEEGEQDGATSRANENNDLKLVYIASTVFGEELMAKIRFDVLPKVCSRDTIIVTLKNKLPDIEILQETKLLVSWGYSPCYVCRLPVDTGRAEIK
ncbi:unnamed protein product [Amoebophrya sp. A120]|nr:unnamed protein product [Amoebophrya sp. A120]|eukprot:GSA120T00024108001.1